MSGIIDMQQSNLKPNQRFFPGEPEEYQAITLEAFGKHDKARGWEPMTDPRWNPLLPSDCFSSFHKCQV